MLFRDRGEQGFRQHTTGRELGTRDRGPQQAGIDLSGAERLDLVAGDHFLEREIHLRQPRPAGRDQIGQEAIGGGCRVTDLERAGLSERDPPRDLGRGLGEFEDPPRLGEETAPGRRQPHRTAGPFQERRVDDVLEDLDLPAQRRLGHVEPRRRASEMQLFRDRDKAAKLVQVEH